MTSPATSDHRLTLDVSRANFQWRRTQCGRTTVIELRERPLGEPRRHKTVLSRVAYRRVRKRSVHIQWKSKQCYHSSGGMIRMIREILACRYGIRRVTGWQSRTPRKVLSGVINRRHVMRLFYPAGRCKPDKRATDAGTRARERELTNVSRCITM